MKIYRVGGFVRDLALNKKPKDQDYVVVGSSPEEMERLGYTQVGASFPVFLSESGEQYALAHTERKTGNGNHEFATDIHNVTLEADLKRRDLTMNAMALPAHSNSLSDVIDPYGGLQDIQNKILRHVSSAFADDPVRVLRLARFHARFGPEWAIAPETLELCRQLVDSGELSHLTSERVLMELDKALSEDYPFLFFDTLKACGALDVVFPELADSSFDELRTFSAYPERLKYAILTTLMSDPKTFEIRLRVKNERRSYAHMFRIAISEHEDHPVEKLYRMDAYRQNNVFQDILADVKDSRLDFGHLEKAYELTKNFSFETIPEEQRQELSGKDIGLFIKKMRKDAYDLLNKKEGSAQE